MKTLFSLVAVALLASPSYARAACAEAPESVMNDKYTVQVISKSHMDLQFVLYINPDYTTFAKSVKVVGGMEYRDSQSENPEVPTCEDQENRSIRWHNPLVATHNTSGGSSSFESIYRVCFYNSYGQLISQALVCNSEVGD
ncbi:MAG: hypothetical protein H6626_01660 [Pseudobdellovibrionaceae bacterium]|nr:hypothetical protein [Bdellovibrionales bacterium]USN47824.1 MAG: hypothetical protein H6626_01660 [Pseudobdellovibrionaceae bacterium]